MSKQIQRRTLVDAATQEGHAAGLTCRAIARQVGVQPSTILRAARRLDLTFERPFAGATRQAAAELTNAERRQVIQGALDLVKVWARSHGYRMPPQLQQRLREARHAATALGDAAPEAG